MRFMLMTIAMAVASMLVASCDGRDTGARRDTAKGVGKEATGKNAAIEPKSADPLKDGY
jgi:hypothetical protein